MAKAKITGMSKSATVEINGSHRPHGAFDAPIYQHIDDNQTAVSLPIPIGSHHIAGYIAAIEAMLMSDADNVTNLTLSTPANLIRNQVTGLWRADDTVLKMMRDWVRSAEDLFDEVCWV